MLDVIDAETLATNQPIAKRSRSLKMNSIKCWLKMINIMFRTKRYFASNVRDMGTMPMFVLLKLYQGMRIVIKIAATLFKKEL
jgi:hypothetical protein